MICGKNEYGVVYRQLRCCESQELVLGVMSKHQLLTISAGPSAV